MNSLAWRLRRTAARRYPFLPYRDRPRFFRWSLDEIPEGIVDTRAGIRVRVTGDPQYYSVFFWGDYEPYHTKIYHRIIRPSTTVLDVGTNFGWFAMVFARWVGPRGFVHAFEPVPFIHDLAAETILLNNCTSRLRLNRVALGAARGSTTIRTYAGLPHGHSTVAPLGREDVVAANRCEVTTLGDYCEENRVGDVDFMKVDVEGAELDVFIGARAMLAASSAPIVAFEINDVCLSARSIEPEHVFDELRSAGYSHFFRFSIRAGVRPVQAELRAGDYIAAKNVHLPRLARVLRTGRLFR